MCTCKLMSSITCVLCPAILWFGDVVPEETEGYWRCVTYLANENKRACNFTDFFSYSVIYVAIKIFIFLSVNLLH